VRSVWRGAISFGLVHIPVRLYAATEDRDVKFRLLHAACGTPIRYRRVCETCDHEVQQEELVTAFESGGGQFVVVTEEEKAAIPLPQTRVIQILDFVDLAQIDPAYYNRTYFLEPAEGGAKAYALLKEAMERAARVAISKVVLRSKESLAAVRVWGRVLAMETMFFPDELRSAEALAGVAEEVRFHPNELEMASQLIGNLSGDFHPEKYVDEYRQALLGLIEDKIAGREIVEAPEPARERVMDLVEALRRSVELTSGGPAVPPPSGLPPRGFPEEEEPAPPPHSL
jgi:DNA end-binding protein Ku